MSNCGQSIYKSTDVYVLPRPTEHLKTTTSYRTKLTNARDSIQVNLPAESGEMGVLANHVPSIEQLKPGLVEIIEESGSKQYFCASTITQNTLCNPCAYD
jgi:hypothetical protein